MSYLSQVTSDAPLHYWRCADQGGGILNDIGSTPHAMHVVAGVISLGYSGPNSDGGSVDLSLDANFANSGEAIHFAGGNLTLECFVWSWQHKATANQWIDWFPAAVQYSIYNDGTNWRALYNNAFIPAVGVTAPVDQQWTHLAMTYGGGSGRLYVNGALSGAAVAIAPGAAGDFAFGVLDQHNTGSRGFISEIAVYATQLSAGRIAAHYAAADQTAQPPVAGQAGGLSGSPTNAQYTSVLQQILQSVRRIY